jgi:hypothetical protein
MGLAFNPANSTSLNLRWGKAFSIPGRPLLIFSFIEKLGAAQAMALVTWSRELPSTG